MFFIFICVSLIFIEHYLQRLSEFDFGDDPFMGIYFALNFITYYVRSTDTLKSFKNITATRLALN